MTTCWGCRGWSLWLTIANAQPGLPAWAGTRKVEPIWILLKQETLSDQLGHMQVCTSLQSDSHASTPQLIAINNGWLTFRVIISSINFCLPPRELLPRFKKNNNNSHDSVYYAVIMTKVNTRVHPVHLMNVDWAPGGRRPSDQASVLGLWVRHLDCLLLYLLIFLLWCIILSWSLMRSSDCEMMPLTGHEGAVLSVAMMTERACVFTASQDGTIRMWKAGRCERVFHGKWCDPAENIYTFIHHSGRHIKT